MADNAVVLDSVAGIRLLLRNPLTPTYNAFRWVLRGVARVLPAVGAPPHRPVVSSADEAPPAQHVRNEGSLHEHGG
jgi:hypothetical protein